MHSQVENYYNPIISKNETTKPQEMFDQGEQIEKRNKCFMVFQWIHQILLWVLFIFGIIYVIIIDEEYKFAAIPILMVYFMLYINYIILELRFSNILQYLRNKNTDEGIYQKMRMYFSTKPELSFYCECYHYESHTETTTDSDGNTTTTTVTEKVITYSETLPFPYYSGRDVSGLFYLNCDKGIVEKKKYLKLELLVEVNFADAISYMDYEYAKNEFVGRNQNKDSHFYFTELKIIPGMKNLNLIKLGESESCLANCCCFVLFTLLTLAEIYKLYFNSICVYQKYKIRKLVSTRYDITQPEFDDKYQKLNPQINLIQHTYFFEPNEYNYLNNDYQANLPTEEELQNSEKYKDKIPEYEISTGDGIYQPGVIIDKPGSGYDNNPSPIALAQNIGNEYNLLEQNIENNNDVNNNNGVDLTEIKLNDQGYIPPED